MSAAHRLSTRVSSAFNCTQLSQKQFTQNLTKITEKTLKQMQNIWNEAGYEGIECERLRGDLLSKLEKLLSVELAAEEEILAHAKLEAQSKLNEYEDMCKKLGRQMTVVHIAKMNYTDRLMELERLIDNISQEYAKRQGLIDTELEGIQVLISLLGEDPSAMEVDSDSVELSDKRLNSLKEHRKELEAIKDSRVEKIKQLAKECCVEMKAISYHDEGFSTMPDSEEFSSYDQMIFSFVTKRTSGKEQLPFNLHNSTSKKLQIRLQNFRDEKERRRAELTRIGTEIARLWSLLRVPHEERDSFKLSFQQKLSMETLAIGMDELDRLKVLRASSYGKVIESLRMDILALWGELGITVEQDQRIEFPLYFTDVDSVDDDLVEKHEEYFGALRKRVEALQPILLKIGKRENVIRERIELEHLMLNPERLTARGPNAREDRKKEEAMSNRVKNLDKLSKEILTMISVWEEENGPFFYMGSGYPDRISEQESHYQELKENLRSSRKKKESTTGSKQEPFKPITKKSNSAKSKVYDMNRSFDLSNSDISFSATHPPVGGPPGAGSKLPRPLYGKAKTASKEKLNTSVTIEPVETFPVDTENCPKFAHEQEQIMNTGSRDSNETTATELKERPHSSVSSTTVVHGEGN